MSHFKTRPAGKSLQDSNENEQMSGDTFYKERLKALGLFSLKKRSSRRGDQSCQVCHIQWHRRINNSTGTPHEVVTHGKICVFLITHFETEFENIFYVMALKNLLTAKVAAREVSGQSVSVLSQRYWTAMTTDSVLQCWQQGQSKSRHETWRSRIQC